eukprot:244089-Rhodomonas_salina.1
MKLETVESRGGDAASGGWKSEFRDWGSAGRRVRAVVRALQTLWRGLGLSLSLSWVAVLCQGLFAIASASSLFQCG